MRPSDRKTGPNDPIWYTMIVSGLLSTFLAILDFFDSYHALATLCKLKNLEKLAFLAIFGNSLCKLVILAISKYGRKMALNRPILVQKSIFWTFWILWAISTQSWFFFFFEFLEIFFSPNTFFWDFCKMTPFFGPKMASFCKNPEKTYMGWKKKSKNRKKIFFFRIVQNYPKVTKKAKKSKFRPI